MRFLRALADASERHAHRPFLIDAASDRATTHGEAWSAAHALACDLRRRGLRPGDRLALSLPNSPELAIAYMAALQAGIVVVPLGAGFGRRELRSILDRARPTLALASQGASERIGAAHAEHPPDVVHVTAGGEDGEVDVWSLGPDAGWEPFDGLTSDVPAAIHFTSGTTGAPRGVAHRVRDFVGNAQRFAAATGLDEQARFHHTLPMTYMAGYYNLLLLPWVLGASVVLDRSFDARSVMRFWEAPMRHDANVLWLVPTIMAMLLRVDRGEEGPAWAREHVRFGACGTAPLDPQLRAEFEARYGFAVHESYGLSETLLATSSTPDAKAPPGAVGTALPGVELSLRDASGAEVANGDPGTIHIASPDTMLGYLEAADGELAFAAPLVDERWLDTGDIGTLDGDGQLRITGRSKEVIIRGGVNISPGEIERVLTGHAGVEHAAVVGIPHEILGEDVAAVIVPRDGGSLEALEPQLKALARESLDGPQQPAVFLQIDELPLTPTGKVRKGALRDLVIDRLELPTANKGFTVDPAERSSERPRGSAGRIVDLTHPLHEGMTSFPSPNHVRPEVTILARHGVEGRATRRLVLGTHTGTHMDAPLHFIPGGGTVDELRLDMLIGPAHVLTLAPAEPLEEIGLDRLRAAGAEAIHHPRVLLRYDWSERFGGLAFYEQSPYLSREACTWLVERGVRLLGMDSPSPDDPRLGFGSGDDSPNHRILLGAGVILVEYLSNLARLRADVVHLIALPLPVRGADGSPSRVVAVELDG